MEKKGLENGRQFQKIEMFNEFHQDIKADEMKI